MSAIVRLARSLIAEFEPFRPVVENGLIGYRHRVYSLPYEQSITKERAMELLEDDLSRLYSTLSPIIDLGTTSCMKIAMLSFLFDLGLFRLMEVILIDAGRPELIPSKILAQPEHPEWRRAEAKLWQQSMLVIPDDAREKPF